MKRELRVSFVLSGESLVAFEKAREALPDTYRKGPTAWLGKLMTVAAARAYAVAEPAAREMGEGVIEWRRITEQERAARQLIDDMRNS